MPSSNYVLHKLQEAAAAYLQSQAPIEDIAADHIHSGLNKTELKYPCIICVATAAEAEDHASGNKMATLSVRICSHSDRDASEDEHNTRVEAVSNLFVTDTIAADLTAALSSFTAFLCQPTGEAFGVDDQVNWVSELTLMVKCCGSDIT